MRPRSSTGCTQPGVGLGAIPDDVRIGDVAARRIVEPDGHEIRASGAGVDDRQVLEKERRSGRVEVFVGDRPDFATRRGVVAEGGARADRNDLGAARHVHRAGSAIPLANVAVAFWLTVRTQVVVVGRAIGAPDRFSGSAYRVP